MTPLRRRWRRRRSPPEARRGRPGGARRAQAGPSGGRIPRFAVLRTYDRQAAPWRSGGGSTREVVRWPAAASFDEFVWRVAIADLAADGPFSELPGVDRHLALLSGGPVELTVGGATRRLADRVPTTFPGGLPAAVRLLAGPATDLNVMTRRGAASASMHVAALPGPADIAPPDRRGAVVLVCLGGLVHVRASRRRRVVLEPLDALLTTGAVTVRPAAEGAALAWIVIRPEASAGPT